MVFGLTSEHLETLHAKLFRGTGFKNKMKREEIEARKKRWVFSDGVGKYVTESTLFIFLRGSLIPKLCHLQKNLWIKIYVTVTTISIDSALCYFFISGEEREILRSSRYCLKSNMRITANGRGFLIYFQVLNL